MNNTIVEEVVNKVFDVMLHKLIIIIIKIIIMIIPGYTLCVILFDMDPLNILKFIKFVNNILTFVNNKCNSNKCAVCK